MEADQKRSSLISALVVAVRVGALIAAVPVVGIAVILTLLSAGTAASPPNPLEADPLLYGTVPDTWAEVVRLVAEATGIAAFTGAVGVLLSRTVGGRIPRLKPVGLGAAVGACWMLGLLSVAHLYARGQAVLPPDCSTFRFDPAAWDSRADRADRQRNALGLSECRTLIGATPSAVRAQLDDPREIWRPESGDRTNDPTTRVWYYRWITVEFEHGRVTSTDPVHEPESQMS